jgi:hypothetical protein
MDSTNAILTRLSNSIFNYPNPALQGKAVVNYAILARANAFKPEMSDKGIIGSANDTFARIDSSGAENAAVTAAHFRNLCAGPISEFKKNEKESDSYLNSIKSYSNNFNQLLQSPHADLAKALGLFAKPIFRTLEQMKSLVKKNIPILKAIERIQTTAASQTGNNDNSKDALSMGGLSNN